MGIQTINPWDLELALIIFLGIVVVLVTAVLAAAAVRPAPPTATREEIRTALAAERSLIAELAGLGFRFQPERDHTRLHGKFDQIDLLQKGSNQYTENHFIGHVDGHPVVACEYHCDRCDVISGEDEIHDCYAMVFALIPLMMPEVRIRREKVLDEIAATVGFEDIDFESGEFCRRYHVSATNRKFAYDLIHARAIELLLEHHDYSWDFVGNTIAMYRQGWFTPEQIRPAIEAVTAFVKLIPDFIWQDRGFAAREDQYA